jgi:prepilin-type N-terminal cleavage/methylation domain-containing protein
MAHPPAGAVARRSSGAFTLIELLVTVVIIALLAGLAMAGYSKVLESARKTEAISNMRNIGQGILTYAADNNNRLPGPLWPGQIPLLDPNREGRLVRELAPYLGLSMSDNPQQVDLFIPPAYGPHLSSLELPRTFVMNMAVPTRGAGIIDPWGNKALEDSQEVAPVPLSRVPSDVWAFSDADQLHPRVQSAPWSGNTPAEIIHGQQRLALFFGGHVELISEEDLELPASPGG